jgi:hypothetical protein
MSGNVVCEPCFNSALLAYLFQDYITATIARNWKQAIILAVSFVFLYYPFGYFQQPDTGIGIGFLLAGDYP